MHAAVLYCRVCLMAMVVSRVPAAFVTRMSGARLSGFQYFSCSVPSSSELRDAAIDSVLRGSGAYLSAEPRRWGNPDPKDDPSSWCHDFAHARFTR